MIKHRRPTASIRGLSIPFSWVLAIAVVVAVVLIVNPRTRQLMVRTIIRRVPWAAESFTYSEHELQQLATAYTALQQECQSITDANTVTGFSRAKKYQTATATVIGANIVSTTPLLILNIGSTDGVREGMPVIIGDGILIGIIFSTESHQSTLLSLTHPSTRIAASILNGDRTIGIVQGSANLSMQLTLIPRSEKIDSGQVVITSGLQSLIPRGLTIGMIGAVHNESTDIFQTADLQPLGDPKRTSTVGVIIGNAL